MFTAIKGKVITEVKLRGGKVIDELMSSNRGKVRLISRAEGEKYGKGKKEWVKIPGRTNDHCA